MKSTEIHVGLPCQVDYAGAVHTGKVIRASAGKAHPRMFDVKLDNSGAVVKCAPRQIHRIAAAVALPPVGVADIRVLPSAACGDLLTVLGDSTLSIEGIAAKLGDSSDKGKRYVADTLAQLLELRLVRSYDGGGITWYELVNQGAAVPAAAEAFDLAALRSRIDAVHTAGLVDLDTEALSPDARLLVRLALNALDTARIHVEQADRLPPRGPLPPRH